MPHNGVRQRAINMENVSGTIETVSKADYILAKEIYA